MPAAGRLRGQVVILLLAVVFLTGSGRPAGAAVIDYLGRPVMQVRLELEGVEVQEPAVLDVVITRVGQPLSMSDVRETIGHLFGLGRYEDVQVSATMTAGGVGLVYDLIPIHHVRALEFRGTLGLSAALLRTTVTDRLGPTPPVGRASDGVRLLEDLYRDHGYRRAMIATRSVIEHKPDRTTLMFEVNPGARTRVGMVRVEAAPIAPEALFDRVDLRPGQPFEPVALVTALERYRAELQDKGYYEARANFLPRYSSDEATVDLSILVETGPLVTVRFEGDPLPERERDQLIPIARERSVDEDLLEDSKRRIENRLKDDGYRDGRADYRRVEGDGTLTVIFTITRGPQYRLAHIDIVGNTSVPTAQLRARLRLKDGEPFVDSILAADVSGMADLYRRQGFADVKIEFSVLPPDSVASAQRQVTTRISVSEGLRAAIRDVTFTGNRAIAESRLRAVTGLTPGGPFYEPQTEAANDALAVEYINLGYQNVRVERIITFTDDRRGVDVAFRIQEGVQVIVDHILIVGNTRTASNIIERELVFKSGAPLGEEARLESQRRIGALGLFRRVDITQLRHPGEESRRDVVVTIQEAPATTLGWGGGLEGGQRLRLSESGTGAAEERIEFAPRGFFEVGRRNLWGKNRSIDLFARVSFRPRGESVPLPTTSTDTTNTGYGFNEYRVALNYREPKVFQTPADGLVTGYVEQGIRSSFNFSRRGTRLEVARRLTTVTSVSGRYALDETRLFDERYNPLEQPVIDRVFPQVRLSSFSSTVVRNTRNDQIDPTRGTLLTVDGSLAARAFGSEVGFVKTLVKGFFYRQLPESVRVILAGGATLGLANGFRRQVTGPNGPPELVKDLPASERFYAGGDTTVRGFALDRLGTRDTLDNVGFPKGGHGLIIFNAELRAPVWRAFEAVGFLDVGNVFAKVEDIDLGELRGGVGFGVRYRSPVGPIRVDLGFKLSRFEFQTGVIRPDGTAETKLEPLTALHISLGQAF